MKIMLVDDESSISKLICGLVCDAGYEFCYAENGAEALGMAQAESPDLIVMDVMMPEMDGFMTCHAMRQKGITAPVIFLSAKGDIVDKGIGFQVGGDDYMTKPFDPRELMMHIEAHLRRSKMSAQAYAPKNDMIAVGRFVIDSRQFRITKQEQPVKLTPKEFKIFKALAENPGEVFSKEQLVETAWGREFVGETQSVTVFIKKLRSKIEDDPSDPRIIETVWGIGYRLNPDAC